MAKERKIRMLETKRGSPDGATVLTFEKDVVYAVPTEMSERLAQVFVDEGWAKEGSRERKSESKQESADGTENVGGDDE